MLFSTLFQTMPCCANFHLVRTHFVLLQQGLVLLQFEQGNSCLHFEQGNSCFHVEQGDFCLHFQQYDSFLYFDQNYSFLHFLKDDSFHHYEDVFCLYFEQCCYYFHFQQGTACPLQLQEGNVCLVKHPSEPLQGFTSKLKFFWAWHKPDWDAGYPQERYSYVHSPFQDIVYWW